ncbi:Z1 domain-containing protein [Spiroplasma endosymbiont of Aspidapion aeneum]|uniref:Z1 domain-containing protein n=1 Tax=Spiroplasma endosymbiont of Aspidapion aeneum TaxID=3066276 RepID=UPI00313EECF8
MKIIKIKVYGKQEKEEPIDSSERFNNILKETLGLKDEKEMNESLSLFNANWVHIINNYDKYKNFLIYGDVQSGKTLNLIYVINHLFENDKLDIVFYLTGSTNDILFQNQDRFTDTFKKISNDIATYINSNLNCDNLILDLQRKKKVIISSIKQKVRSISIVDIINALPPSTKILIVDDEADDYTISNDIIKIYKSIETNNLKKISITASPFYNIYKFDDYDYYKVLKSPNNYCGINKFDNKNFYVMNDPNWEKIVFRAFLYWICITASLGLKDSQFLLNIELEKEDHWLIKKYIRKTLDDFKKTKNLPKLILEYYPRFHKDIDKISNFICNLNFDIIKTLNSDSDEELSNKNFEILIGGKNLSRGITFKNLLVEVMVNMGKKISAGTLIQRARWFGYRNKMLEHMMIFVNDNVINAYNEIKDLILWTKKYDIYERNYLNKFNACNYEYIKIK